MAFYSNPDWIEEIFAMDTPAVKELASQIDFTAACVEVACADSVKGERISETNLESF